MILSFCLKNFRTIFNAGQNVDLSNLSHHLSMFMCANFHRVDFLMEMDELIHRLNVLIM